MFVLSIETSACQLLCKVVRNGSSETFHNARIEGLLDGTASRLDSCLLLVNGRLRDALLEDAIRTRKEAQSKKEIVSVKEKRLDVKRGEGTYTI